jgi:hypothetical protein
VRLISADGLAISSHQWITTVDEIHDMTVS